MHGCYFMKNLPLIYVTLQNRRPGRNVMHAVLHLAAVAGVAHVGGRAPDQGAR